MRKQDELADPASCMSRAHDHEMTFVLLGRDAAAPGTIHSWVAERLTLGKNQITDPQIAEALECADTMKRERLSGSYEPLTETQKTARMEELKASNVVVWRCTNCGEAQDHTDPRWAWGDKEGAWKHHHKGIGYFNAVLSEPEEVTELRDMANDWHRQFNDLWISAEKHGYTVQYGEHGRPEFVPGTKLREFAEAVGEVVRLHAFDPQTMIVRALDRLAALHGERAK